MRVPAPISHVDGCIRCGIDDGPWARLAQRGRLISVLEVELGAANSDNRYRSLFRDVDKRPRQLAGRAGDEDGAHRLFLTRQFGEAKPFATIDVFLNGLPPCVIL